MSSCEGHVEALSALLDGELLSVVVAPRLTPISGAEPCRTVTGPTLCMFTGLRETVAVVASRPETAKAFQKAAWIVGSL